MVSTPIRAQNVVITEPSRAVNPLPSDIVTPIPAQSDSTQTIVLPVHDALPTLPTTTPPEPSTPTSSNPRIPPGPVSTLTSPFPPSPSPSQVQQQTEIACPDCCSLPSSFSFPLDLASSNALESSPSNALHQSSPAVSTLPVLPTSSTPTCASLLHDELLPTPTHSDSMAILDTTMVLPFTTPTSPSDPRLHLIAFPPLSMRLHLIP